MGDNVGNKAAAIIAGAVTAAVIFVVAALVLPGGNLFTALVPAVLIGGGAFFGFARASHGSRDGSVRMAGTSTGAYVWNERARVWMRFDGKRARRAIVSANPASLQAPHPVESQPPAADAVREKALHQAVEEALLSGSTVMQRNQMSAILSQRKPINHPMHIVLSVITVGMWLTPYLIIALTRGDIRYRLEADHWGHVWPVVA